MRKGIKCKHKMYIKCMVVHYHKFRILPFAQIKLSKLDFLSVIVLFHFTYLPLNSDVLRLRIFRFYGNIF